MAENKYQRLSDKIFDAMKMAIDQQDLQIAEQLLRAMEMAMTRGAGGKDFVERRAFSKDVEAALMKINDMRKASQKD